MKSLLPIYISIFTIAIVLFFTKNQKTWTEMSTQKKVQLIAALVAGILVLIGFVTAYIFVDPA